MSALDGRTSFLRLSEQHLSFAPTYPKPQDALTPARTPALVSPCGEDHSGLPRTALPPPCPMRPSRRTVQGRRDRHRQGARRWSESGKQTRHPPRIHLRTAPSTGGDRHRTTKRFVVVTARQCTFEQSHPGPVCRPVGRDDPGGWRNAHLHRW